MCVVRVVFVPLVWVYEGKDATVTGERVSLFLHAVDRIDRRIATARLAPKPMAHPGLIACPVASWCGTLLLCFGFRRLLSFNTVRG